MLDPIAIVFQLAVSDGLISWNANLPVTVPDYRNDLPVLESIPAHAEDDLQSVLFQAATPDADGNDLRFALVN